MRKRTTTPGWPDRRLENKGTMPTIIEKVQADFDARGRPYTPQLKAAIRWLHRRREEL